MILGTRRTQDLGIPSHRFRAYIRACRRLGPHRLVEPASLTMDQALVEPLFHNLQVTEEGGPLAPTVDLLVAAVDDRCGAPALTSVRVGDFHVEQAAEGLAWRLEGAGSRPTSLAPTSSSSRGSQVSS